MAIARRVYLYGIALVALGMLVNGLAGLLQVGLAMTIQAVVGSPAGVGANLIRGAVSINGALTAIGLITWLIHWGLANRPVRRGDDNSLVERRSGIRKLFLYAVLLVSALDLTFSAAGLVGDLLRALLGQLTPAGIISGSIVQPLARIVIAGAVWFYYARVAGADRQLVPEAGAGAKLRRWYVYILSGVGLFLFLFATAGLLQTLWEAVIVPSGAVSVGERWLAGAVAGRLGSLAAGLALWALAWRWSNGWFALAGGPDLERHSVLRKTYLYLVIAVAVGWTVSNLGFILYRLLRTVLIPVTAASGWWGVVHDLGGPLATALVLGVAWFYHAHVVEREARLAGERRRQAAIRWLYQYLVALVGGVTLSTGLAGTMATLVDLAVQPGAVRPTRWWEDRISLFATLVIIGLPLWFAFWGRLQRESGDPLARQSLVRRIYMFLIFGLAVLTLLGSGAFTLYQFIRLLLGEPWTAGQTSEVIAAASAAAVAALQLAYHLRAFRRDAGEAPATPAPVAASQPAPVVALAVIHAPSQELLEEVRKEMTARAPSGVQIRLWAVDPAVAERVIAETTGEAEATAGPRITSEVYQPETRPQEAGGAV